jgi:tetraacyldisaccharide 4'-kinase
MREPAFWWRESGPGAGVITRAALGPFAAIYGNIAARRMNRRGRRMGLPVVCIGNPTVGGAGKTPLALAAARMLIAAGEQPVFLSRGYGGGLKGPMRVDPSLHRAEEVGDEPLLLARVATTVVARDRVMGARVARVTGASVIVMDDGFQNPSLAKDFSVLVVDARRGVGNARVIPAGPLRAPLGIQLDRAHALVVVGLGLAGAVPAADARARDIPLFQARVVPDAGFIAALGGGRVLAFAGIGDPEKFFATLADAGVAVAATRRFDDHHRYTQAEARALCDEADRDSLVLVTTEKDMVRISGEDATAGLAARAQALPVTLAIEDEARFKLLLQERIVAARLRVTPESAG